MQLSADPKPKTIHIKTFGCQMNVYDSDRMQAILTAQGFVAEPDLGSADVILLNTCAIRDKAEHKVLSLLGQLKPLKDKKPDTVIGVTGCVGQRIGRSLLQKIPHLDLVMGPDSVDRIGILVDSILKNGKRVLETELDTEGRSYTQNSHVPRARPAEYMTIMKGCDHFCTYCIVPFVRGREKSRSIEEILQDTREFAAKGTKEITFLGQNINTYGKGTGQKLSELIEGADAIEGLERIRYVTSHPRDLSDDLIQQFGSVEKLCPALHLPAQSGSDPILKRMSRLYTSADYRRKAEALRRACPEIALSGDIIVGFPGETDADFVETLRLVEDVRFASLFMFKYSPRPGTRAFDYGEPVPKAVMDERLLALQEVANRIITEDNLSKVGRIEPVLIESMDKKHQYYFGRTPGAKPVHVLNAGDACIGKIIDVEITEASTANLRGYYVDAPRRDRETASALSASL